MVRVKQTLSGWKEYDAHGKYAPQDDARGVLCICRHRMLECDAFPRTRSTENVWTLYGPHRRLTLKPSPAGRNSCSARRLCAFEVTFRG
jgi:hypothetical protein